jgi:hypothetical protein
MREAEFLKLRGPAVALAGLLTLFGTLYGFQKPWREYPGVEYNNFPAPADAKVPAEWVFARIMYPPGPLDGYSSTGRFTGDYRLGASLWTQDYPRADRHLVQAVRRLSRIDTRSVEQVTSLDDDDVFNYPWIYAVQVGEWGMTQKEGAKLREYLQRGGFFMADDFHGNEEWAEFEKRIRFALPDRPILEMPDNDPYFHTVFDITDRPQTVGWEHLRQGCKSCDDGGRGAHWRGIYDDKGRVMVGISYNSDMGDSWEYADNPVYPEHMSDLAMRIAVNSVVYAMTH